jgi:glycerol-3-phosphate dehydrogenase subunit B
MRNMAVSERLRRREPTQRGPHVVVVGAGLAGLVAALRARTNGARVTLAARGIGGLPLSQGTIDVLGYSPAAIRRPFDALGGLPDDHPYRRIGADGVRRGLSALNDFLPDGLLEGGGETNMWLPTAVGAWRPTLLAPASMTAGARRPGLRLLAVGIRQLKDFQAPFVADNLQRACDRSDPILVRHALVDLTPRPREIDVTALTIARALSDDSALLRSLAAQVRQLVRSGETIAMPAVLGVAGTSTWQIMQELTGAPVCEIPLQPPSIPGLRLYDALTARARHDGVRLMLGTLVTRLEIHEDQVAGVDIATAGRTRGLPCDAVILATGGLESGAIAVDDRGVPHEQVADLPLSCTEPCAMTHPDLWGSPQQLFRTGVMVDSEMRPIDQAGRPVAGGLYACGDLLAGAIRWDEKSGEGITVGSAVVAADACTAAGHPRNERIA